MARFFYSVLLLTLILGQGALAESEFICPCVLESGDPTSMILRAGVRNYGEENTGVIRVRIWGNKDGDFTYLGAAYYPEILGVGENYSNAYTLKFPFYDYGVEGNYEIYAYLQEIKDGSWETTQTLRFEPVTYLDHATGGGLSTVYLNGTATANFSSGMDEVTVNLPPIKNMSPTDTIPPLSLHLGLFETPKYWAGYYPIWEYPLEYSLEPSSESEAISITMPFTSVSGYEYVHLSLQETEGGQHYLWQNVSAPGSELHRNFRVTSIDTLQDTDGDGVSDFNESLMQTNAVDASRKPGNSTLDVMVLYTPGASDLYLDLEARVVHVLEYGNLSLQNSNIGASLRLVHLEEVEYSESVLIDVAYDAMLSEEGVFSGLSAKRINVGADLVVLFRSRRLPSLAGEDTCGLGTMPNGQLGDFKSIIGQNFIATAYIDCRDRVTIHELGHNMGLAHDRREALSRGTFAWSKGHAVDDEFATIMAYGVGFPGSLEISEFSSPDHTCQVQGGSELPCGVDKNDIEKGADAALSIDTVRFQVAQWAPDPPDNDSDGVIDFEDPDDDNDGFLDIVDAFPLDAGEHLDTDLDGVGNNADTDDDGDGIRDMFETIYGLDPLDATDAIADGDGDGESNLVEFNNGTDPTDAMSFTNRCLKPELDAPVPSDSSLLNEKKLYIANPGSNINQQTFLRFINNNSTATEVELYAIDDTGARSKKDPITFTLSAQGAKQMNAQDIENGNANKGITTTLCDGQGKWQLVTRSSNPIEVMGLIRTPDGFLTSLNDVVPEESGSNIIYFANPASNTNQQTFIRVVNTTANSGTVTIAGIDDSGAASAGSVSFTLTPNQAKQMTVQDLENGNLNKGLSGSLGDGTGKWRLTVTSVLDLKVMSLIRTKDGFLTNLSGVVDTAWTDSHKIYFANPASQTNKQTFLRIINKDDAVGTVTISAIDDNGNIAPKGDVTFTLNPLAAKQMVASDLEYGNLNKGLNGYLGSGSGRWQLTVTSLLNLEVMSLVRTPDGFLTNLSGTVRVSAGISDVFIFNPASNTNQRSSLRIVNTSSQQGSVTIQGFDDTGAASSTVTFNIIGKSAMSITSQELESGSSKFVGALGDGAGKWRLQITSNTPLQIQSLLDTPTGFLTNLSRVSE